MAIRPAPSVKIVALNLPAVAALGAAGHVGLLDRFVADPLLGIPCGFVLGWLVLAIVMLACGSRWADRVASDLIPLGLIGTVLGIVVALGSVSVEDIATLDGTIEMAGWFIAGMATAFYTTLIGAVGHFWYGWLAEMVR